MVPAEAKPEYVIMTRPSNVTGEEILITNKGNTWIKGHDDRTGAQNGILVGEKFIIRR